MIAHQDQAQSPVHTPMPAPPSSDFMTPAQWEVFYALVDGVLPSITSHTRAASQTKRQRRREGISSRKGPSRQICLPDSQFENLIDQAAGFLPEATERDAIRDFLEYSVADDEVMREDCSISISKSAQKEQLGKVLKLLDTRVGSLLLTGYLTPITAQPTHIRQSILQSWSKSRLGGLRGLSGSIALLAHKVMATSSLKFHDLTGYTNVPKNWSPGETFDFNFIQIPRDSRNDLQQHVIETDVVIVGSGYGGGVSAKNLAEAGHGVLVVDKGYYFPPCSLPMPQKEGLHHLYDNGAPFSSDDGGMHTMSGGCWGGGGSVNWSMCLKPQGFVRKEWADGGLPMFTSQKFDECIDRVWKFVGADTSGIRHDHRNKVLLNGSKMLGFRVDVGAQNTAGKEHYCGQCHLGCGKGIKRGPAVSWLPAAAQAGARFMEGLRVDRVVFGPDGKTAIGVEGEWTSRGPNGELHAPQSVRIQRRVMIKAKRVIISAGSIRSPLILMNSGIKNDNLGKNLHLHPVKTLGAIYSESSDQWEGAIMTSVNGEFENLDGKGHGVKIETLCMVPTISLALCPWVSGADSKMMFMKYGRLNSFIVIGRDRNTGRVFSDPKTGEPRIEYKVSDLDCEHVIEGIKAMAKICYVTGANEIQPNLPNISPFIRTTTSTTDEDKTTTATSTATTNTNGDGDAIKWRQTQDPEFSDPKFAKWLKTLDKARNSAKHAGAFSSAHQMGTCRMGKSASHGVVDEKGRVWGREGLFVADASVFPSASGVNPMITVMSVADWISRGVDEDLKSKESGGVHSC